MRSIFNSILSATAALVLVISPLSPPLYAAEEPSPKTANTPQPPTQLICDLNSSFRQCIGSNCSDPSAGEKRTFSKVLQKYENGSSTSTSGEVSGLVNLGDGLGVRYSGSANWSYDPATNVYFFNTGASLHDARGPVLGWSNERAMSTVVSGMIVTPDGAGPDTPRLLVNISLYCRMQ
jgi:hypothetical protein